MADEKLHGKRVAFLFTDGVERVELAEPLRAVRESGADAKLVSLEARPVQTFDHLDPAASVDIDLAVGDASSEDFDALVLPGGVANPDSLRTDPDAVRFVREFVTGGKPVGVICHGPWTLVEAGVLQGRTLTSWPSLQTDIRNAGGTWVDEEVHVDGTLVSSRNPDDLPAFCEKVVEVIAAT